MNTLKNVYNTAINFLAKWLAKGATYVANLTTPLLMSVWGWPGAPALSTEVFLNFLLGAALHVGAVLAGAYLCILLMTGLTLLLALLLPVLVANLIALVLTIALVFIVANRAEEFVFE